MSIVKSKIRTIPDYPKPGILFRDITSLLIDPEGFQLTIGMFVERYQNAKLNKIAAIDARGFIPGAALAFQLGVGFVPIRKKGKLPGTTISESYALEYGVDHVEIHTDAISAGERVLIMDDLIATGGTLEASIKLIQNLKGIVHECSTIINLPDLGGAKRIKDTYGIDVFSICEFEGH
ncbi:adenine phosphoribosyltransferase [Leptospira meyeri]|uniref:Adenine phosphoribosyltransferase n=1 Tax=Leptospira meyeri TaxID=29508 RepID=A0A4R8MT88_LEPME|nr:adenine phosphoribosyltransferase [Leptospira meyeri]PKA24049.1 adenine phosphoribosyltransferase [Leptospira sp. mixed culture ATI2-C-A1]EKJ85837.1 adenine phosphoribosyltransferase [Leptospira meyeri serovar Hardjo str. Went 5]EMJ87571.1 adenine phosphoribosyltransferase [Leptospira meyeri serovar Semaranga str. Veldrot Semarang 173]MCW7490703.1 adenine phosphoribosyltransferase [Leptospira meyeri]PJZ80601.1 adenine phosphoribosyltransferase [Leptospira meyeri]